MKLKQVKIGATGRFPRGHADASDEGELRMAITADYGQAIVRLNFGTPTAWIGLPVAEARELAAALLAAAEDLERRKG